MSARFVTVKKMAEETGYSARAIHYKIDAGIWPVNEVWYRAPDGRRLIDIEGYEKWVQKLALESSMIEHSK